MARAGRRAMSVCCCAIIGMTVPGCSLITVRGPPKDPPPQMECTESGVAPMLDTIVAVVGAALAVSIATEKCTSTEFMGCLGHDTSQGAATATVGVGAVVYAISAGYGYWKTARCRTATACVRKADGDACKDIGWPPPPALAPVPPPAPPPPAGDPSPGS